MEASDRAKALCADCISRQAATDALRKMQTYKLFSGDDMLLIDQAGAMTELMLLPSAQPKRGRWATTNLGVLGAFDCCSECKRVVSHKEPLYNFCPNCGADMRGEQDG